MHIFQFKISFPSSCFPTSSENPGSNMLRIFQPGRQMHVSRSVVTPALSVLTQHPGAQLPSILGQPISLLRFHVRMLLKLILSLSSRSSFSQRSQAATGTGGVSQLLVFMKSTRFLCLQDPHPFI